MFLIVRILIRDYPKDSSFHYCYVLNDRFSLEAENKSSFTNKLIEYIVILNLFQDHINYVFDFGGFLVLMRRICNPCLFSLKLCTIQNTSWTEFF